MSSISILPFYHHPPGTYAAVGTGTTPAYEYGYGRATAATTGYPDASKTYYQQAAATGQAAAAAAAGYTAGYDQSAAAAAAKPTTYATTYTQRAAAQPQTQAAVSLLHHTTMIDVLIHIIIYTVVD